MENNICRFLPNNGELHDINILNFVYEKKEQKYDKLKCDAMYKMHLVLNGHGRIHVLGASYELEKDDVFFTFPSMSYAIESEDDFEYMYISYIGLRANVLMDKINISKKNFLFRSVSGLIPIWKESIVNDNLILNLRCEGILLYSFSILGEQKKRNEEGDSNIVLMIKKYIDENFSNSSLCLESISEKCAYNKKYISTLFKKKFNIGIAQYISMLRIQHACTLMEQGFTSVKDIAFLCGFSEPFYFSTVFKSRMGISPRDYIQTISH